MEKTSFQSSKTKPCIQLFCIFYFYPNIEKMAISKTLYPERILESIVRYQDHKPEV